MYNYTPLLYTFLVMRTCQYTIISPTRMLRLENVVHTPSKDCPGALIPEKDGTTQCKSLHAILNMNTPQIQMQGLHETGQIALSRECSGSGLIPAQSLAVF